MPDSSVRYHMRQLKKLNMTVDSMNKTLEKCELHVCKPTAYTRAM
jgi:hypothetical protein